MTDGEGGARPGRGEVLAGLGGRLSRLLPDGVRGRRRFAEVGAVAGVAIVVLALVGATVALRPTSAPPTTPEGPGLPVPVEVLTPTSAPPAPTGTPSSSPVVVVPGPVGRTPYEPLPTRGTPLPTASGSPTSPAPSTSRASVPVTTPPPVTKPPTPSATVSPTPSPTASASTTSPTPTEPTDPPVPPRP